jgi:hypothetical protein
LVHHGHAPDRSVLPIKTAFNDSGSSSPRNDGVRVDIQAHLQLAREQSDASRAADEVGEQWRPWRAPTATHLVARRSTASLVTDVLLAFTGRWLSFVLAVSAVAVVVVFLIARLA